MIGILETCECGTKFLRGIYPQKKCEICDLGDLGDLKKERDRAMKGDNLGWPFSPSIQSIPPKER